MDKAAPPIEYASSLLVAGSWWQVMQRAGFAVRFYTETYGHPSTKYPPQLVDSPTPYGGWVYRDEALLGAVAWDSPNPGADTTICRIVSKPPQGDILHWILIGSGVEHPELTLEGASQDFLHECLGRVDRFYEVNGRFFQAWPRFVSEAGWQTDVCSLLPSLKPPYFAVTIALDSYWRRTEFADVCIAPVVQSCASEERHIVAVRTRKRSSRFKSAFQQLEAVVQQSDGKTIDPFKIR